MARRRLQNLQALHGLKDRHMDMLLSMAACLDSDAGEVSLSLTIRDLGRRAGLSQSQAKRVLSDLHDRGFIVRHQPEKVAGCEAITTLLPLAFEALGYSIGDFTHTDLDVELPWPVRKALCGQAANVVLEICSAWLEGRAVEPWAREEYRGEWSDELAASLQRRAATLQMEAEEAAAAGDTISTAGGAILVDGEAFSALNPGSVPWDFIKDVVAEIAWRAPDKVTPETLPALIAEAAYSRQHAPFCRDLPWKEAVWRLGGVMARPGWGRPRRIWEEWYVAARQACGALLHRKRALAIATTTT